MTVRDTLTRRRNELLAVAARHGAWNVRIFGSVARGEDAPESDVDLLIDLSPDRGWADFDGAEEIPDSRRAASGMTTG
jgi:hypothetical protein